MNEDTKATIEILEHYHHNGGFYEIPVEVINTVEQELEEQDKKIERLKSRLEEYQEYVEINHKEIERLNNIINNTAVELEILLQSENFELITMQLRNIVFRLKGSE